MQIPLNDRECPECGSFAFELPDENGDTWCAVCHECVNVEGRACAGANDDDDRDDGDTPEDIEPRERRHTPQVAGQSERPIELQMSPLLAGADSRERRRFLDDGEEW